MQNVITFWVRKVRKAATLLAPIGDSCCAFVSKPEKRPMDLFDSLFMTEILSRSSKCHRPPRYSCRSIPTASKPSSKRFFKVTKPRAPRPTTATVGAMSRIMRKYERKNPVKSAKKFLIYGVNTTENSTEDIQRSSLTIRSRVEIALIYTHGLNNVSVLHSHVFVALR